MYELKSTEQPQKCVAEKYLTELLDKICRTLHIRLDEWEPDKELYTAILSTDKSKFHACSVYFEIYDYSYNLIRDLKIKINPNYKWFTSLGDHIN